MAFGFVEGQLMIVSIACWVVQVATDSEVSGNCPLVESLSCGTTTLQNGEVYDMVPKLITDENIYLPDIPELENIVTHRLICKAPACISNPCQNGGTCLETIHGFDCICTPELYGPTCATEFCTGEWLSFEGSCYQVFLEIVTFHQALEKCRDIDLQFGHVDLVSIHSDQEMKFILDLCQDSNEENIDHVDYWIGFHRPQGVEGAFVWTDGTPINYTSWSPGEPNDLDNLENCGEINLQPGAILEVWNDFICNETNHYICKVTFNA